MAQEPPLDETVWTNPSILQHWGGLSTNNILFYFAESPFFDRTSNNATVFNQANFNPAGMGHIIATRAAFESHLRSMTGLEFVLAHDPSKNGALFGPAVTGAWVVRKQIRRQASGTGGVEVLAEYYIVGDRVFQAPTVAAVMSTRLLSTAKALASLIGKASEASVFEPAKGHFYPRGATTKTLDGSASTVGSRSATPVAEVDIDDGADEDERHDAALLMETFANSMRYGREYMDEHPLVGEPGNFTIDTGRGTQAPLGAAVAAKRNIVLPTLSVKTDLASAVSKREKGGDKSPLSPTGTGATKKRKKNKAGQTPREPKTPGA